MFTQWGPAPHSSPSPLSAHAYCCQTVARFSNCWALFKIHCVSKTSHLWLAIVLTHNLITIIFGGSVTEKVRNQSILSFPSHLSSASALPCEIGNPEDSTLVHCACNTVQLLQSSRLPFSWTMHPTALRAECIDYIIFGVMQHRECESWVKKIE